ncbi:MAG: hypothetical protein MUD13_01275 [Candidatus Nanopelagicales bacterium]|nr:hypothetical protein [Candidatus Nanopelagicales bacterium]
MQLGDVAVVVHRRAAHGIRAEAHAGCPHRLEVEHVRQVAGVGVEVVVPADLVLGQRRAQRDPPHVAHPVSDDLVGPVLDPAGGIGVRRAAVRRVVLEAAVGRRVVRGRHDDAVGQAVRAAAVVGQDRVAQGRGRGVAVAAVDEHGHVVGGEHLEGGDPGRLGQAMGVLGQEQRPVGALLGAVLHDRLGRGQDVELVEGRAQARAAVAGGAERDALVDVLGVRLERVVGRDELGDVDEVAVLGRLAGALVGHGTSWAAAGGRTAAARLCSPARLRRGERTGSARPADHLPPLRRAPAPRPADICPDASGTGAARAIMAR